MSKKDVKKILSLSKDKREELIHVLQKIQESEGYISPENIREVGKTMNIPFAEVYGVVTFYSFFKLTKNSKYTVYVCDGTACHVRGSEKLIKEIKETLKVKEGEITPDGLFSYQIVRCLGLCASAPLMKINDEVYPKLNVGDARKIIQSYQTKK
jgi:NADH:ubiquinone oxidoreductase subunit E